MTGSQRWRGQSLFGHAFLTGPESKAEADGHMPFYADAAIRIASAAAAVAGMAKKRWRDQDRRKMSLASVKRLRAEIDCAFAELEQALEGEPDPECAVINPAKATASFQTFGRLGYLALANLEEAGEIARPLHALAIGAGDPVTCRRDASDAAAAVRITLHVTSESLRINPSTTTEAKWGTIQQRYPEIFATGKKSPPPAINMSSAVAGLAQPERHEELLK